MRVDHEPVHGVASLRLRQPLGIPTAIAYAQDLYGWPVQLAAVLRGLVAGKLDEVQPAGGGNGVDPVRGLVDETPTACQSRRSERSWATMSATCSGAT
jgi:hypothetical protein